MRGVRCQGRPRKNASRLATRRGHPASHYMRPRDRERERTARSDNGGGESGGGPPGVDGGDSKAEGVDDRQSALKRIGMMPRQCGQTIVMSAAFAGSATADILGVATYDGQGQAVAAGPKQPTSRDGNHTSAKCRMHRIQMHTACLKKTFAQRSTDRPSNLTMGAHF
jgi:hypothetical protein